MAGKHVPVTPGWDCHGLPIELKVSKEFPGVDKDTLRKKCRESATGWIEIQKEEFKNLGVMMDWNNPYYTMDFVQEADTVRAFEKGPVLCLLKRLKRKRMSLKSLRRFGRFCRIPRCQSFYP